jgi:hypothetical protein
MLSESAGSKLVGVSELSVGPLMQLPNGLD